MQSSKRAKAGYHRGGGALPFALHPPIFCVSGRLLRTSVHGRYARTQEKGQGLIYNSSLLLCNMIYSSQHNNCERAQFQMDINRILSERAI